MKKMGKPNKWLNSYKEMKNIRRTKSKIKKWTSSIKRTIFHNFPGEKEKRKKKGGKLRKSRGVVPLISRERERGYFLEIISCFSLFSWKLTRQNPSRSALC